MFCEPKLGYAAGGQVMCPFASQVKWDKAADEIDPQTGNKRGGAALGVGDCIQSGDTHSVWIRAHMVSVEEDRVICMLSCPSSVKYDRVC